MYIDWNGREQEDLEGENMRRDREEDRKREVIKLAMEKTVNHKPGEEDYHDYVIGTLQRMEVSYPEMNTLEVKRIIQEILQEEREAYRRACHKLERMNKRARELLFITLLKCLYFNMLYKEDMWRAYKDQFSDSFVEDGCAPISFQEWKERRKRHGSS